MAKCSGQRDRISLSDDVFAVRLRPIYGLYVAVRITVLINAKSVKIGKIGFHRKTSDLLEFVFMMCFNGVAILERRAP